MTPAVSAGPVIEGGLAMEVIAGPAGPLRVACQAAVGRERGRVLLLQGRAELIEKYAALAATLAGWGYAVITFDWRGQGGSGRLLPDPRKGHVGRFTDYLQDLQAVLAWQSRDGRAAPDLVLGHSMGGHLALLALGEGALAIRGAVLAAPMLGINMRPWPTPAARLIAGAAVRLGLQDRFAPGQVGNTAAALTFPGNTLTTDKARFQAWQDLMRRHERIGMAGVTFGWLDAALASAARLADPAYLARITVPLLLLLPEDERIVDNEATLRAAAHLPAAELHRFPGARHDLFLEAEPTERPALTIVRAFLDRLTA